jgi:hypothetical protein
MNIDFKKIGSEVLVHSKRGLTIALTDVLSNVVIPQLYDPLLDKIKGLIPGTFDDAIIEGFRPSGKKALIELASNISK